MPRSISNFSEMSIRIGPNTAISRILFSASARMNGVAVDAVIDSVSVGTTYKEELSKYGIIFMSFGEAVRDARYALEWNQQDLADKMKMSRGSIANIETGRQRILLTDLFDFAKVLRVKPIVFFNAVSK